MRIVYDNGDVNVTLVTLICIVSILTFFILISIFSYFKKKEEAELETYYEDEEVKSNQQIEVRKKKVASKSSNKKKVNVNSLPVKHVTNQFNKPLNTYKNDNVKNAKPKKVSKKKKSSEEPLVHTATVSRELKKNTVNKEPVGFKNTNKPKIKQKPINAVDITESKNKSTVIEVKKSSEPEYKVFELPVVEKTKFVNKPNQTSFKVEKVGSVQVREDIKLNEAERNMLSGIFTSNDRGHIIQIFNGAKIMDFNIDNPTQLNHIERQISKFSDSRGSYVVYVVWESNLKYRIQLSQKLKYNPTVRYK